MSRIRTLIWTLLLLKLLSGPANGQQPPSGFLQSDELSFLVQLSSRQELLDQNFISGHFGIDLPIFVEFRGGFYRYYTGPFNNLQEAKDFRARRCRRRRG